MISHPLWQLNKAARKLSVVAIMILLSACSASPLAQLSQSSATITPASPQQPASPTAVQTQPMTDASFTAGAVLTQAPLETPTAIMCKSPMPLTDALTEGPYFKAGSPERVSLLEPGMSGQKLVLSGYVLNQNCKPMAHALLDFWQADASGQYDNSGYTLRGHQYTDAQGHYQLETIIPGLYPGRTEHIHVKVQAPDGPTLTTQLFFPGVTTNNQDGIYDPKMLITIQDSQDGELGTFNFVVSAP